MCVRRMTETAFCPLHGTVCRFWQLERPGCALREVNVSIQRKEELQDKPFTCRVGEIMVRDCAQLLLYLLINFVMFFLSFI